MVSCSKITLNSLELGLKLVSAFSLWATYSPFQQAGSARVGGSKCKEVLLKILTFAAKRPFASFRIFTAEFLDSFLLLFGENAEAADAGILF